jgi:hypothetical protein
MSKFESGLMIFQELGSDKLIELPTVQCVHCGGHWHPKPPKLITRFMDRASAEQMEREGRKTRGFCIPCNGPVCGPDCAGKCVPEEQMLENIEQGRALDFTPIVG